MSITRARRPPPSSAKHPKPSFRGDANDDRLRIEPGISRFADVEVTATVPAKPPVPPQPKTACANPDALGVSCVVEIDTTGGPGFGFAHFKQLDFLTDKEIVLTFDDGPWPVNTPAVLKAL